MIYWLTGLDGKIPPADSLVDPKIPIFAIPQPFLHNLFTMGGAVGGLNCYTLWLFNIAMVYRIDGPFIDGLPGFTY